MYWLERAVLPVDAHVLQVGKRLGLLEEGISGTRAHDAIHAVVPPEHRYALHVGLVRHGREVCRYRAPLCGECVLRAEGLCAGFAQAGR